MSVLGNQGNQFGFMTVRLTMKAIYLSSRLMDSYGEKKRHSHMIFIVWENLTRGFYLITNIKMFSKTFKAIDPA